MTTPLLKPKRKKPKFRVSVDESRGQDYTAKVYYSVGKDRRIQVHRIERREKGER